MGRTELESRKGVVVLQPANFRDGDDVVWRVVWATWNGYGRRMRSLLWMPYKHPRGRRAQWLHIVPTIGIWPSGSATPRLPNWKRKHAGTCSSYGGWGTPGVSCGGRYPRCGHWRRWYGYQSLTPAGFGDVQSGRCLKQWHALTGEWRSSGISRGRVMAGHGGRYTEWQSYRSPACYGWVRQPPTGVEDPAAGDWGFTPSSVTHISSGGRCGATAGRGCHGWTVRGHVGRPPGTRLPARVRLPPNGHGNRPQRLRKRPRAMARVEAGWIGGLTLVGVTGPMPRLVGSLDV